MSMFERPDPELLAKAVFDQRWAALARAVIDLGTLETWDPSLPREKRILVPIDVQAFVVGRSGGEATVAIRSFDPDPAPFAAGTVRQPGVHLHWAMPDALLVGKQSADGARLELPALPDRWVIVRALLPEGIGRALVSGWVIDAASGAVNPLATFAGTFPPAPAGMELLEPLDGGYGGSLLWTASYEASLFRFALHDPLDDLAALIERVAPKGFHEDQAVYTVCGWWSRTERDPLAGRRGRVQLDQRLAELGWLVSHDGDDATFAEPDPRLQRWQSMIGFRSASTDPPVEIVVGDTKQSLLYERVQPNVSTPVDKVEKVIIGKRLPTYSTLVHGAVLGVPIAGVVPVGVDDRPPPAAVTVAVGLDVDDVVAAFGADALALGDDQRANAEQLVAAFAGNVLDRLSTSDGLSELAEREHAEGFWSFVGPPLPTAKPDRLRLEDSAAVNPNTVGRKGRASVAATDLVKLGTKVGWRSGSEGLRSGTTKSSARSVSEQPTKPTTAATLPAAREVVKAAPRLFRPNPPLVALRGAKPSHRHHDDGLYDESGKLRCRYPAECVTAIEGVVSGAALVPTLGNGAVPSEVLVLVREAVLLDPYAHRWLAAAGTPRDTGAAHNRVLGEMARLYGATGTYDPSGRAAVAPEAFGVKTSSTSSSTSADPWAKVSSDTKATAAQVGAELARFSQLNGTPPSPIAVTTWRQPWIPMWLEWKVTLSGNDDLTGWHLGAVDLERLEQRPPPTLLTYTYVGRSTLNEGVGDALRSGIDEWLKAEQARDAATAPVSQLSDADEAALASLADKVGQVDLVSASLDGIREQLLGIGYLGHVERGAPDADGRTLPLASGLPTPLFGGTLTLEALRIVDTFGRVLTVPLTAVHTSTTLEVPQKPTSVQMRPRVQHAARWLFRLVDPAYSTSADPALAPDAFVDQIDPAAAVNPVIGFLLPDHVDEALEFFDVAGTPLGQLAHDEITGGVYWEPAPGRPLPPDAGPLADLDAHTTLIGRVANGVVHADVSARTSAVGDSSSLSAMLRAIDTTLWTVDTFAALGSPTVAGLVGRPIAVVRATVRLELPDDLDEVSVSHAGGPDVRRAAFAALDEQRFPIRLGDLHRSDDSLLGFFVDDDYLHLHVVDRAVLGGALESGRHKGFLGMLGDKPQPDAVQHPYLVTQDTLWLRPGQTLRLTMLMLPAGKVHLTTGIVPRKSLALGDDWVTPGLSRLMPSLRVGPVLLDPSEVRLPLVNFLGDRQTFTRRTGPLTWRDDPIVAATQSALLPRLAHEVQEGWIRVIPTEPQ